MTKLLYQAIIENLIFISPWKSSYIFLYNCLLYFPEIFMVLPSSTRVVPSLVTSWKPTDFNMDIDGLRSIILFLMIGLHKLTLRYLGSKGSRTMLFNKHFENTCRILCCEGSNCFTKFIHSCGYNFRQTFPFRECKFGRCCQFN